MVSVNYESLRWKLKKIRLHIIHGDRNPCFNQNWLKENKFSAGTILFTSPFKKFSKNVNRVKKITLNSNLCNFF